MTPTQLGDLIRSITAFIQGGVMVTWVFILIKARDLEHGIRLRHWAIRCIAVLFLLFTYLTVTDVVEKQGQPPGSSLLIVPVYLLTVGFLTFFVVRDLRREYQDKSTGDSEGGQGGTGGQGGPGGPGPGGGTGGAGGKGGTGGRGSGDQPGRPGEPGKPGEPAG